MRAWPQSHRRVGATSDAGAAESAAAATHSSAAIGLEVGGAAAFSMHTLDVSAHTMEQTQARTERTAGVRANHSTKLAGQTTSQAAAQFCAQSGAQATAEPEAATERRTEAERGEGDAAHTTRPDDVMVRRWAESGREARREMSRHEAIPTQTCKGFRR